MSVSKPLLVRTFPTPILCRSGVRTVASEGTALVIYGGPRRAGGGGGCCRKEDKRAKLRRRVEVEEERIRGLLSVSVGINLLLQLAFHFTGDWYLQLTTSFYCISLAVSIQSFTIGISFQSFTIGSFISKFYNPRYHTVCGHHSCLINTYVHRGN